MFDFWKVHKTPSSLSPSSLSLRLISSLQGRQQSLRLGLNPIYNAVPCCTHDNIVGIRLCDECKNSILLIVCHMPESILWLILQACCGPTLTRSTPNRVPNSALKFASHNLYALLCGFRDFLAWSVRSFNVMVRTRRVREVHTHQQYTLFVDCDRRCCGSFDDEVCPIDTFSPILVHQYSNSMYVCSRIFKHPWLSVLVLSLKSRLCSIAMSHWLKEHPTLHPSTSWVEFSDLTFFCSLFTFLPHLLSCIFHCWRHLCLCFHFLRLLLCCCCSFLSVLIPIRVLHLCYACTLERHRQCVWDSVCLHLFPSPIRLLGLCVSLSHLDYTESIPSILRLIPT